jgi:crotonobetainyl-CoA:carnitine CoA-transferase CaiB-like acyl-CoA transferase
LFEVDQYRSRQAFSEVNAAGDSFAAPSTPFRLFSTPPHLGGPVAELGADNALWSTDHG